MQKKTIPLLYRIILKKLWGDSIMGTIKIIDARMIFSWYHRMGKQNWNDFYFEMIKLGYFESHGRKGGIKILVNLNELC